MIEQIKTMKIGKIKENVLLKEYTTYKVGGKARLLVSPNNITDLILLLDFIKTNNIKYKIIGNGSNLIFSDNGFDGVIIKLDNFDYLEINDNYVKAGAGCSLIKLALKVSKSGLSGMEFATGIPGTLGGAIYMNAGAYKSDMGYVVSEVKVLTPDLQIKTIYNRDLDFHYRSSFFQKNPDYIILEAKIVLKKGDKKEIMDLIESRKQRRVLTQPLEYPSAGSVFRNPENAFAGELIEKVGYKGKKIGGAMVSEKHANFIVNYDNAKAEEIIKLINDIKKIVKEEYNIELKCEQEIVE